MAISTIIKDQLVHVGDQVKVYQEVVEDEKTRTQIFEGVVISIQGKETGKSFVVRKIAVGGVGVERIWPVISPHIKRVEVKRSGRVRRAKLFYLRNKSTKDSLKLKESEESKASVSPKPTPEKTVKEKPRAQKKTG